MIKPREILKCSWIDTFGSLLLKYGKLISFGALFNNRHVAFILLILYHCIVVLFELCIDNNQIFFPCHPGLF